MSSGWKYWLAAGVLSGVLCVTLPVEAAKEKRQEESWHSGAGIAVWIDPDGMEEEFETDSAEGSQEAQEAEAESETASEETDSPGEKEGGNNEDDREADDLVMADVSHVLNVRREPNTEAELAGYLYADCGGIILEQKDGWTRICSGELTGWAKDDYLLFGEEAQEAAKDVGRTVARTTTDALRIRKEPSMDAGVYDLLEEGAEYEVVDADQLEFSEGIEISEEWIAVDYEGKTGFVSSEYVEVEFVIDYGETIEQVAARQEEEKRLEEERKAEEEKAAAAKKKEEQQREIEKTKAMEASDLLLLAALIQCEAGSDVYEGQVAVGAVVMNRVKSSAYPNTIRDVIFASGQFTPAGSGKLGRVIASDNVYASCMQAAQEAMAGASPVGTATHFRRAGSREGIIVGQHVFW